MAHRSIELAEEIVKLLNTHHDCCEIKLIALRAAHDVIALDGMAEEQAAVTQ